MNNGFGGLQIVDGTLTKNVLSTGTEIGGAGFTEWAAITPATHGDLSVVPVAATGRLTLVPGTYRIDADISVENSAVSGLSSEDVTGQESIQAQLYLGPAVGQFPTAIAGTKAICAAFEGLPTFLHISAIVEITQAHFNAGTNKVSIFLGSALPADTNADIIIRQARFLAMRLN